MFLKTALTSLLVAIVASEPILALQVVSSWQPAQLQQPANQFVPENRQPIAADLQNQVNALSAQLNAANRQLRMFQHQLTIANQQQQQPQTDLSSPAQLIGNTQASLLSQALQSQEHQHQPAQQQQQQLQAQQQAQYLSQLQAQAQAQAQQQLSPQQLAALIAQQQQVQTVAQPQPLGAAQIQFGQAQSHAQQQQQHQPQAQEAPVVSTLADGQLENQQQFSSNLEALLNQARQNGGQDIQRQQQHHHFLPSSSASTTASPTAYIEQPSVSQPQAPLNSFNPEIQQAQQEQQQQQQQLQQQQQQQLQPQQQPQQPLTAPSLNQAPPHNPPKNDDKFSIGLGVLSPGYTQKFGNTALDFNQDKNGFSFTLSNNGHTNQPQQPAPRPST